MKIARAVSLFAFLGLLASLAGGCTPATPEAPTAAPATPTTEAEAAPTSAPSSPTPSGPPQGGELVIGLSWEPSKIDPHRTAAENGILPILQACETLTMRKSDGTFVPGLATSWEVSEDGTSYTFHLREGVEFHDGTPFNAEAVKYNLDRIVDPDTQSEEAVDHLGPYVETEVVDEYTAVVHLESPFAAFMDGIGSGWLCMVSPAAAEEWGPEEFQDHFVGTGPFIFEGWERHEQIRLTRNPDYWGGPEFFEHQGLAYLDSIVFKFVEEATVRSGTLETGEIHVAGEVPALEVDRLDEQDAINVLVNPAPGTGIMLLFNMSKSPTDDVRIRRAINYAVDQAAISQTLYEGILAPSYGPLSPVTPCYWAGCEDMYPYDPEQARSLLDEAGWVDADGDGIREKDGEPLRLDFPTHGSFPVYRDPAPLVEAQLREVGIDVNVMNLAVPAWLEAGRTGEHHIGIVDWRASDPDFNLRLPFHSENKDAFAWNWHSNDHLDELLEEGMTTPNLDERCSIYEEVQQIIMEDAMIKPINIYAGVWGVREEVKELRFDDLQPSMFWAFDAYIEE